MLAAAKRMDKKAKAEGLESIAPLYGLPIPMKGTMATDDFISSAGVGILHDLRAKAALSGLGPKLIGSCLLRMLA